MLKRILLFSFAVFINLYAFSQYKNIDSLKTRLTATTGKQKADVLVHLARSTYKKDPVTAQKYLDELELLAKTLNYENGLINHKLVSGKIDLNKKDYDNALAKLKDVRDRSLIIKDTKLITETYYILAALYQETNKLAEIDALIEFLKPYKNSREGQEAIAKSHKSKGMYYYYKGNFKEAGVEFIVSRDGFKSINDLGTAAGVGMNYGIIQYKLGDVKESIIAFELAMVDAKKFHDTLMVADCLTNIAISEYALGNMEKSVKLQEEANAIYQQQKNTARYQSGLLNLSGNLLSSGKTDLALKYVLGALENSRKNGNQMQVATCLHQLADIQITIGDTLRAIQYLNEDLELSIKNHFARDEASALRSLGQIETNRKHFDKALEYLFKSEAIFTTLNTPKDLDVVYIALGNVYLRKKEYVKAEEYYNKSLEIAKKTGNKNQIAGMLSNIGVINYEQGKYDKSIEYYTEALAMRKAMNMPYLIADSYFTLSNTYYNTKDFEKSYEYYKKYHLLLDSVRGVSSKKEMAEMQTKYEIKEKEQQIGMLSKEQEVKTLLLAKNTRELLNQQLLNEGKLKEIDLLNKDKIINANELKVSKMAESEKQKELEISNKDKLINEKEANRQKQVRYIFTGGFIVALILALFILRSYVQKRKDNTLISHQKKEVEHQNELIQQQKKEITDSINYAQRIQQAILPHSDDIKIKDRFILYKPKDIVSGDFYFYKETATGYLVAVADCTGHGVPGAFMSLIGSKELKEITEHTAEPAKILSRLNVAVKNTLKQNREDATRDGMDIALIHVTGNKILFSGANRPLWYIEKSTGLLKEIKATKHAIGGLTQNDQVFEQQEIDLIKGDVIYLSSDGFADQFGGEKGKKLTTKKMKDELVAIYNDPMDKQEKYLDSIIEKWRGGIEQLDDICVIGIRI